MAIDEPVIKTGTYSDEAPISLAMLHFLNAKVNTATTLLHISYTLFMSFFNVCSFSCNVYM